ncbi:malto-oligosyltrehalose trehalohydrolase [Microbacterium laevaniformans]|uniref:Malto-oligosyltrehalose trehalohydrolase n=1 Tax=Microbacterium laevaniformans TaxID=36807 RepID=A0A4S2DCE4_9MICO|nr:malto-oligosyltrehalose trehalohydrolase [Microbacterium laevaniformans]TGY39558.1 malto-oligosyltrehalose trehalohydrolase [Microbacterium laevaniformans]
MTIEVWAPRAARVRLRRPGLDDVELTAGDAGWWASPLTLTAGDEYGFVLDDGDVRPDPRSRRQPRGVHDLSAWDDAASFVWSDAAWTGRQLAGGLIYELHVGTFTREGTLDAAIGRLPHLVELGVTHVELLPVNGFNGTHNWGYDGVLWYTVQEDYGGPEAYRRFVDAAHGAGLAVVQDVVYNHLGPSGNYLPEFGPYLRDGQSTTWGSSIDLDQRAVRDYIIDNALMWLGEMHVDGLRLDAVHALHESASSPVHILQEIAERVDALSAYVGRPLSLIAESDLNDPIMILPREAGGYGLTAQWVDDWHHAVHVALTGETEGYYADFADPQALPKTWTGGFYHDGTFSSFRGRDWGAPLPAAVPSWRLVTFAQDHDQIGNRAAGDRLSQSLTPARLEVAAVLTMTAPGTPMLFMGEEWGASTPWQFFTSHPEPELAAATREGRKAEFARMGWDESLVPDPNDPATFERSKLDWSELDEPAHARLLSLYRALARLRREHAELTDPDQRGHAAESVGAGRWVLHRDTASVYVNLSPEPWIVDLTGREVWLATTTAHEHLVDAGSLVLSADSAAVVGARGGDGLVPTRGHAVYTPAD